MADLKDENTTEVVAVERETSSTGSNILSVVVKVFETLVKAVVMAFTSVFKALRDVLSRLDMKGKVTFLLLVVVIVLVSYVVGYQMGGDAREKKISEDTGLTIRQLKDLGDLINQ